MEKIDFLIMTILIFISLSLNVFFYFELVGYIEKKYYKIGYCEGQGGEILEGKCIDKKYILEIKK